MKMPKGFNKWTLSQQEDYFVKKLTEVYELEAQCKQMLGKIRGGQKVQVIEMERPDEIELKS